MEDFIIDTRDFCCKTERLKKELEGMGYRSVHSAEDRKYPGRKLYFFEVDDRMVEFLTSYFGKNVVWTYKK